MTLLDTRVCGCFVLSSVKTYVCVSLKCSVDLHVFRFLVRISWQCESDGVVVVVMVMVVVVTVLVVIVL